MDETLFQAAKRRLAAQRAARVARVAAPPATGQPTLAETALDATNPLIADALRRRVEAGQAAPQVLDNNPLIADAKARAARAGASVKADSEATAPSLIGT